MILTDATIQIMFLVKRLQCILPELFEIVLKN